MKAEDVLKLLEKHEGECNRRYAEIQDKLKSLDSRIWGVYGVIIVVAVLEKVFQMVMGRSQMSQQISKPPNKKKKKKNVKVKNNAKRRLLQKS